jgi:O-antigen ligase
VVAAAVQRWSVPIATGACAGLAAVGIALAAEPKLTLGLIVAGGLALLVARAPLASLLLLLFLTCVVPYGIQNRLGVGGGVRAPGLLLSDLLLIAGMARAVFTLALHPVERRIGTVAVSVVLFVGVVALQFVHGVASGHDVSRAGQECRVLLGFGTFLITASLVGDAAARRTLLKGLVASGILLGLWGMLQWFGHLSFGAAGDVGVRTGVRLTSGGSGQLQGGEYGFPVVVVACTAVLLNGGARTALARAALWLAIALNALSCLVTFERTFWLSTILGLVYVILRAPAPRRLKAILAGPFAVVLAIVLLGAVAPATLTTARERVLSLGQYSTDDSVRYRVVESELVLAQVRAHPLAGSGLAAEIFWGQPWAQVPAKSYAFTHNGYLWLAWKLGIPAAVLLVLVIGCAVLLRAPPGDDVLSTGVRRGAQAGLLGLLLATITFPSFNILSITPAMGVLIALAIASRNPGSVHGAHR